MTDTDDLSTLTTKEYLLLALNALGLDLDCYEILLPYFVDDESSQTANDIADSLLARGRISRQMHAAIEKILE